MFQLLLAGGIAGAAASLFLGGVLYVGVVVAGRLRMRRARRRAAARMAELTAASRHARPPNGAHVASGAQRGRRIPRSGTSGVDRSGGDAP